MSATSHSPGSDADAQLRILVGAADALPAVLFAYTHRADGRETLQFMPIDPFTPDPAGPVMARIELEPVLDLLPADARRGLRDDIDAAVQARAPFDHTARIEIEGSVRHFRARSEPGNADAEGAVTWSGLLTDVTREVEDEAFTRAQQALLEQLATSSTRAPIFDDVCRLVEGQIPGAQAGILHLDPVRRTVDAGVGPTLPGPYLQALIGHPIGPEVGSCGTAMYYGTPVISADIQCDPKWAAFRQLAESYELRACWSVPFFGANDKVAGSLSAYFSEPRQPRPRELDILRTCAHIAGIYEQRATATDALNATEAQLLHAQKMEAVGQLAGGIAHDFNNILTVIQGSASLLTDVLPPGSDEHEDAEVIVKAASRAESLTRQLLTFGRRQTWEPTAVSVNEVIRRIDGIVRRLLGERVDVRLSLEASAPPVWVDETQLEQVLINLAVNAHDAMPDGGQFEISTRQVVVEDETGDLDALVGAPVVRLEAKDTGEGMDSETQRRIFEPFYSTKPRETRSGLGLSVAYAIMERAGGRISVASQPGEGACFRLDFPVYEEEERKGAPSTEAPRGGRRRPRRGGSILLVEDEPMVRSLAARTLRSRGYEVVEAEDGQAGLEALIAREGQFDVVISDVVMPNMTGSELLTEARKRWPDLPIMLMTGYADDVSTIRTILDGRTPLLTKPFTPAQLALELERALEPTTA